MATHKTVTVTSFKIIVDLINVEDDSIMSATIWSHELAEKLLLWREHGWHIENVQQY